MADASTYVDPETAAFRRPPAAQPESAFPPGEVPTYDDPEAAWMGKRAKAAEVPETPSEKVLNTVRAASGAAIEALPIVGPPLRAGLDRLSSVRLEGGSEEAYKRIRGSAESLATRHPEATSFGKGTGMALGWSALATKFPELFGMVGNLPTRAVAGGTGVAATSAADAVMRGEDPATAGIVGGLAGLATPVAGAAIKSLVKQAAPAVAALARTAIDKYGIAISAEQLSKNQMVKFGASALSKLPLTGATAFKGRANEAFYRGVTQTFGENAPDLSTTVIERAHNRIGGMFERFIRNVPVITRDPAMDQDLIRLIQSADQSVEEGAIRPIAKQVESVLNMFQKGGGAITGAEWKSMTQKGSALWNAQHSKNPSIAEYANKVRDVLNGVMERSASPADAALIKEARRQYKNLMTVEPLVEKAATGEISPVLLQGAVAKNFDNYASGGGGDLGELARIGNTFWKEMPSSGTSERSLVYGLLESGVLGGLGHLLDPKALVAGVMAPSVAGRAIGTVLRSKSLVNSLIRPNAPPGLAATAAPVAAAIAGRDVSPKLPRLLPSPAPTEAAP